MKPKITDQISISEMRQMRADGLSNKEIAKRLEICYPTVLKYLGKQPRGIGTERRCALPSPRKEPAVSTSRLKETARAYSGVAADFSVFANRIRIVQGDKAFDFPLDGFVEFAKDIIAVSQIVRGNCGIQL